MTLDNQTQANINTWLTGNYDQATKAAIQKMIDNGEETALTDSFYKSLEFGTGGLRGEMGIGSNRMNKYTVGAATQGLANYLKKSFPNEPISVAIAYDSRNNSSFFAQTIADIFSANGIKVFLFSALRPTPQLSFAIRYYGCKSGVMVTASHNPREYNGYKAYWDDGCQVTAPHDKNIIAEVNAITDVKDIRFEGNPDLIVKLGEETDKAYLDRVKTLSVKPDVIARQKDLTIVFSPLHGTGITLVPKTLELFGFTNVHIVEEQATPDGNFPTVVYPNPEEREAMTLALKKAAEVNADLVLATDPDADRVGVAAKNKKGEFVLLNGNQTATLLCYYMLNAWKETGKITGKEFIVKTIVTTDILDKIAAKYGVKSYTTLTGFKFIGEKIKSLEGKETYIVGGEESYGYLAGDFVRDKDAVSSCALIAEMTAYAKDKGLTLFDLLYEIYATFGYYKEHLISLTKKGKAGAEEINNMMEQLRKNPPKTICGEKVTQLLDYQLRQATDLTTQQVTAIELPKSNVIQLITEKGTKVTARPSGTEPKIKFYFSVNAPLSNQQDAEKVTQLLDEKIKQIIAEMKLS